MPAAHSIRGALLCALFVFSLCGCLHVPHRSHGKWSMSCQRISTVDGDHTEWRCVLTGEEKWPLAGVLLRWRDGAPDAPRFAVREDDERSVPEVTSGLGSSSTGYPFSNFFVGDEPVVPESVYLDYTKDGTLPETLTFLVNGLSGELLTIRVRQTDAERSIGAMIDFLESSRAADKPRVVPELEQFWAEVVEPERQALSRAAPEGGR